MAGIDGRKVYEFRSGEVWQLLEYLLDNFIRDCRDLLEQGGPYPTEGAERFGSDEEVRGALRSLRRMKGLPDEILVLVEEANANKVDSVELIINSLDKGEKDGR